MKAVRRAAVAVAVLVLVVVVGLALALPRLAASEGVRARLVAAVEGATKRSFSYRSLGAGLLPPRLVLEGASLAGAGERPAAEAGRIELRLAVLPLLARAVVVRSLDVKDAAVALVRDGEGVHLAGADLPEKPAPPRAATEAAPSARRGFDFAVERLALANVDVRLEDARPDGGPPIELRAVEGKARARALDAPVEVSLRGVAESAGALAARGPLALRATLDVHATQGTFELEASEAELGVGRWLHKPAGTLATLQGTFRRTRGPEGRALRLDGLALALADLRATLDVELAPRRRAVVSAPTLDVRALAPLVPALAGRDLAGSIALEDLTLEGAPLAVHGRVRLEPLGLGGTSTDQLVLRGDLEGLGDELVGRGLHATVAGRDAPVELRVHQLATKPRFAVATKLQGADAGALVAALGGKRDLLEGPLDLDARLEGRLGGRRPVLATLDGEGSLRIAPGRLRGASKLRSALDAAAKVGRTSQDEGDRFDSLAGRFVVERGVARTDDLRLAYPRYAVDLRGSVGLADRALDLKAGLAVPPGPDAAGGAGRARSVALASVRGTVDDPDVELTNEAIAGAASAYAGDERRRQKWEKKLDERLGPGQGQQVLEALDKVLESLGQPKEEGAKPAPPE